MTKPITLLTLKQYKLDKSLGQGYFTAGLQLSPANEASRVLNRTFKTCCAMAGACSKPGICLCDKGLNIFPTHVLARATRTAFYWDHKKEFFAQLINELDKAKASATRQGLKFAVRLNVLSDIEALPKFVLKVRPQWTLYDYSKIKPCKWSAIQNYTRVFSFSERATRQDIEFCIQHNINIAVCFDRLANKQEPLPKTTTLFGYKFKVLNGDKHDLLHLQKRSRSHVIGLAYKGSKASMESVRGTFVKLTRKGH
jgi:hypothetical protein